VTANILNSENSNKDISWLLKIIDQPARIQILMAISEQEACVCHLEAALKMRQASISQHLMVLRKAGLVTAHRDSRNIFYRLAHREVIQLLENAANLIGIDPNFLPSLKVRPIPNCPCPQCNPGQDPELSCSNLRSTRTT
jgi:ArsR family transcriptional regulator